MKIRILDDKEEGGNRADKNADDNGGNDSVTDDEMSFEPRAKKQKLEEDGDTLEKDSQEQDEQMHAEDDDRQIAIIADEGKEPIVMSIWVWQEVLKSITRMEMAERVSLVCHFLKKLCWPRLHGNKVTPHIVESLEIRKVKEKYGRTKASLRVWNRGIIPIATDCPVPDYIQGFKMIYIQHMNSAVLNFVRQITPRLNNICLHLYFHRRKINTAYNKFQCLFNAINGCSISSLDICSTRLSIMKLRQKFPGLLENIFAIKHHSYFKKDHIELNELISAKFNIGKPFVVHIYVRSWGDVHSTLVDNIREAFLIAVQPQSFMIQFDAFWQQLIVDVFQLENESTNEVLNMEFHAPFEYKLYRCPRGEVQHWMKETNKAFGERTGIMCSY